MFEVKSGHFVIQRYSWTRAPHIFLSRCHVLWSLWWFFLFKENFAFDLSIDNIAWILSANLSLNASFEYMVCCVLWLPNGNSRVGVLLVFLVTVPFSTWVVRMPSSFVTSIQIKAPKILTRALTCQIFNWILKISLFSI